MATITIDNKTYEVDEADNLLSACLGQGFDLPYFCWHPAMGSVGACRQCAVKQYKDRNDSQGGIVMACMTQARDGARISIQDPESVAFRKSVIEWLMINHPHDCPVCEEGGECHLQDMTVMTGHAYRRYRFKKRTFRNQYLGPFINHEMNRCITCYRCVRFYQDYAGGDDLQAFAAHNHVYFGRHENGALQNEFSGNLVEVCPTGVFTDKTLGESYTRKWDLRASPSVCVHCGLGCNTSPNERYGELRRIVNRYNFDVNGYFLCDRGRFGYSFVNSDARIRKPLLRRNGAAEVVSGDSALGHLRDLLLDTRTIGIGSPRASLESNFMLRERVGETNFYQGVSEKDGRLVGLIRDILTHSPVRAASLREAEQADAVLVLGEDLTNTAPRLALSLRQAVRHEAFKAAGRQGIPIWMDNAVRDAAQDERSPLFIASTRGTRLDDVATQSRRAAQDDIARLGFAIAHALNNDSPAVEDLDDETRALAERIAQALRAAERPLVVSGYGCGCEAVIQAAANIVRALSTNKNTRVHFTVPECNSLGLALMGGGDLETAFTRLQNREAVTLIVLENDLYQRAERRAVDAALAAARHVVVLDHLQNNTTENAELVLPAGTFAESDGTLVSSEGRAQRFFQTYPAEGEIRESWRWLSDVMRQTKHPHPLPALTPTLSQREREWKGGGVMQAARSSALCLDDVTAACSQELPVLGRITEAAPPAGFRKAGMKLARAPHRYSGRTAMDADIRVSEPKPPDDPDSALSFTMEGYHGRQPAPLIPYVWAPGWNSEQSVNKFQDEIGGALRGGPSGVRLIEPRENVQPVWFGEIPPKFKFQQDRWLIVPLYHVFGSEPLSARAPAVVERVPEPYVALNSEDAARLEIENGEAVLLTVGEREFRLPAALHAELPSGTAGLPVGLVDYLALPAWGRLEKAA